MIEIVNWKSLTLGLLLLSLDSICCLRVGPKNCAFDTSMTYEPDDLIQCLNELSLNLVNESTSDKTKDNKIIAKKVDNNLDSGYEQSDYRPNAGYGVYSPGGTFPNPLGGPLGGLNVNIFEALNSISQYDDLKCVPRIICEMTSGGLSYTGRDIRSPLSSMFENFGGNSLTSLLTLFDASGSSTVVQFAKAAILGYSNRGSSNMCYREYEKCPTNRNALVNYLNNHKGGFFRIFNRPVNNNQQQSHSHHYPPTRPAYGSYRILNEKHRTLFTDSVNLDTIRTGTGKLKFDLLSLAKLPRDYKNNFFPNDNAEDYSSSSKIAYPSEHSPNSVSFHRQSKSLITFPNDAENPYSHDYYYLNNGESPSFFPKEK